MLRCHLDVCGLAASHVGTSCVRMGQLTILTWPVDKLRPAIGITGIHCVAACSIQIFSQQGYMGDYDHVQDTSDVVEKNNGDRLVVSPLLRCVTVLPAYTNMLQLCCQNPTLVINLQIAKVLNTSQESEAVNICGPDMTLHSEPFLHMCLYTDIWKM